MKIKSNWISWHRSPRRIWRVAYGTVLSAVALVPGLAQVFPPQGDDAMSSMGVFKLVVAPAFRSLLAPDVGLAGYPGYQSVDGRLTSPLLIDSMTTVGRSAPHNRPLVGSLDIGLPSMGLVSYGNYPFIPSLFATAPAGTREILTQIRSFALLTAGQRCTNNDPRVPVVPISWRMIYAGPGQGVTRKSIGMVQERLPNGAPLPDFPARSFFDIFVEANLPPVPGTKSVLAFPGTGAVLYNDIPLVITNLDLTSLPPQVVYIHGETTAVPLKFKSNNAPYWFADDVFGYVVLAGHGTQIDCSNEPALTAFLNTVLGPIGQSAHEMPIEWPFPTDLCPAPGSSYSSAAVVDIIGFPGAPGVNVLRARSFQHRKLDDPITPPPLGGTATYSSPNTVVDLEFTIDNFNWIPTQAGGPVKIQIRHSSDSTTTQFFDTEMLQLDLQGNTPLGPLLLRESPTRQSLGKHTIRKTSQGYLISSFFDVFLEASIDGGASYTPADRAIRVQLDTVPCGAAEARMNIKRSGSDVSLYWSDPSYRLQTRASLSGTTTWVDVPGMSPVVMTLPPDENRFFRLICP
ncbi:MAG: hypothetical protein QOF48_1680 [Verrucomicrobiota bacterium]|jgi:hypothetical protein